MEIRIDVKGVSCHGSAPERGDNAIYKMADILQDVRALNENDAADETEIKGLVKMLDKKYNPEWEEANFLGRGTVTTSEIFLLSDHILGVRVLHAQQIQQHVVATSQLCDSPTRDGTS